MTKQPEKTMTDKLRQAAEMALEALDCLPWQAWRLQQDQAAEALRQALAEPEQEQEFVGACVTCGAPKSEWLVDTINTSQECVDETAKGRHEPVAWRWKERVNNEFDSDWILTTYNPPPYAIQQEPLYTAPPSIEAAVLAEREFAAAQYEWEDLLAAADAKLKEKNT